MPEADPTTRTLERTQVFEQARTDRRPLYNWARLQAAVESEGLDAVIASSPENVTYTGGCWLPDPGSTSDPGSVSFVVTTGSGKQGVVINEADCYYFNEYSWISDVRGYAIAPTAAVESMLLLQGLVSDLDLAHGAIGVELSSLPVSVLEQMRKLLPQASLTDCSRIFDSARLIKTPDELDVLEMAAYCTDKAIQTALAFAAPGTTEKSLAGVMQGVVLQQGADALRHAHVHAGVHSTIAHSLPLELPMQAGDVLHVDFGASFAGYASDISRNAIVGNPARRQREIYSHLFEIEQFLTPFLSPGTLACDVFKVARQEFEQRELVHPWATFGHGISLGVHEGFEFSATDQTILEPGMVVCIEPSHIEQNDARYHIEDTLVITDGSPRLISNYAPIDEMFVIR